MNNRDTAFFAGGCFWGVEHFMRRINGVISVESGYMGGALENPTYYDVKQGTTGHAETVRVLFNPTIVSYQTLAKCFFEIHDPCQINGQGVDIGTQYRSEIFYDNPEQKAIAETLISMLKSKGYAVTTKLTPVTTFYLAEDYHQNYTEKHSIMEPECHHYVKRF
ncbi:MAG: peptide-methionine (S)-S-oxide reductase MsrA [Rikenellaceae bacterium]